MSAEAARLLRLRAESYAGDAGTLRQRGELDDAVLMEAIRDELRQVARVVEAE